MWPGGHTAEGTRLSYCGCSPFLLVTAVKSSICSVTGVARDREPSRRGEMNTVKRRDFGFDWVILVTSKKHSFLSNKPGLLVIDCYRYF